MCSKPCHKSVFKVQTEMKILTYPQQVQRDGIHIKKDGTWFLPKGKLPGKGYTKDLTYILPLNKDCLSQKASTTHFGMFSMSK